MSDCPRKLRRKLRVSLAGCGLLGIYYTGVGSCLEQNAPNFVDHVQCYYCSSAGAISAVASVCGIKALDGYKFIKGVYEEATKHKILSRFRLGMLDPRFDLYGMLRRFLEASLPRDAHVKCRGRVVISLTVIPGMKNWLVSDFTTRAELINAVVASSFIPVVGGLTPPLFRGKRCIDGGFSNNLPHSHDPSVLTISPYAGGCEICPKGESDSIYVMELAGQPLQMSWRNTQRLVGSFLTMSWAEMEEAYHQGFMDTLCYLDNERRRICRGKAKLSCQPDPQAQHSDISMDSSELLTSDYFTSSRSSSRHSSIVGTPLTEDGRAVSSTQLKQLQVHYSWQLLHSSRQERWMEIIASSWRRLRCALTNSNNSHSEEYTELQQTIESYGFKLNHSCCTDYFCLSPIV